jgi:hypothetical protein
MASLTNLGSAFFGDPATIARLQEWARATTTNGYSQPAETSAAPRLSDVRVYTTPHAEPGQVYFVGPTRQEMQTGRIEFSYAERDDDLSRAHEFWREYLERHQSTRTVTVSGALSDEAEQWAFGVLSDGEPDEPSVPRVDFDTPRAIRVRE